jgi:HK97 family phage prohead protease
VRGGVGMNVEVRNDSVIITGYVNAVERYSKPITDTLRNKVQTFIERIKAGVFKTALKRNDDVKVLLNHDMNRELATTKDGTAKLEEDNIGLRAEVTITDKEVVEKAKDGKLVGWSFGFYPNADEIGTEGDNTTRTVTDLDLVEVSILDDTKSPAYYGTSIEARCEGGKRMEIREETLADIEKEAQEKHEQVAETSNAQFEEEMDKHLEIEAEANTKKMELFATMVANKVVEMLKTEQKAEETEEETEVVEEEEETTEEETEVEAEVETETEVEEEPTEEEEETRAIDYSAFENRIANL